MSSELLPNEDYPFDDIVIKTPKALQGGTYSAQLELNSKPIVIQTPKCKTKKGIHKTSKQVYCDLLFTKDNTENIVFTNWLNNLQEKIRDLILENGDNWFHEKPSLDEIEYNWNDSIRTYKGSFNLIRTFIFKNKSLNKLNIQIYDDSENELHLENIDENKNVICILEIKGLKFSSQSFHLEIFLRQVMILNEKPIFSKCLIKTNKTTTTKIGLKNSDTADAAAADAAADAAPTDDTAANADDAVDDDILEDDLTPEEVTENSKNNLEELKSQTQVESTDNSIDIKETSEKTITNDLEENNNENNNLEDTEKKVQKNDLVNNDPKKVKDLEKNPETLVKNDKEDLENIEKNKIIQEEIKTELQEINVDVSEEESIKLKNAHDVYLDIYKKAREKAKKARNDAIKAYLEVKRIKELYMIDVADSSDDEDLEEIVE